MNPTAEKRTSPNRLTTVLVLLLAAAGGCLYYFSSRKNPEIQRPLVGIVLGKIEVSTSSPAEYSFAQLPPDFAHHPTVPEPKPVPSPTPLLKPVEVPGLKVNVERDLKKQIEEAGIPLVKLPTPAETASEDFDPRGPPPVDMTDKSILRVQLNTYRRDGRIYYRVELSLEQPVYFAPGAPKYTWDVERAPAWKWVSTDFGEGVRESDADLKIRIVIDNMMYKFIQAYEVAKGRSKTNP